ncbi:hypothetical protein PAEH1_01455 [Paenalcaligenes hominis]|uniref:Phage protein n=1 Tax=Paenalcaligenes hominis TaxID=643674 RepID=A0A1U9JXR8_9BURK|nr:hypothetical protein [Paenalcaligenes hominis]AQS50546.1 hypothetical protein PAEH1_01455 [Paenalcaligenes hominis]
MFDDIDLSELGLDLPEEKAAALKEALGTKAKELLEKETGGLKSKNSELLGKLKTAQGDLDTLHAQFEGLDIDAVKAIVAKAGQDEESRLIAEGKIDEVVSRRTERLRGDLEKQLQVERERADKAEAFANQFKDRVLSDSIREAATKAGALAEAADDIILRARSVFRLNEDGLPVALDKDGEVIYGKDGKTPLTPLEWAESLQETAPHLWPRAQGAGQTGDRGGKSGSKKRSDMTMQEKSAFIHEHGQEAFLKLPK